ncbi:MAG: hypothetical protein RI973_1399 [Bacteroidota bacterium]|jgi:hypothetical protein
MDFSAIVMWLGFLLAAYSVIGNDVIQTLGAFLTSNEKRFPWYVLWFYAAVILAAVLIYGYFASDISYGRLAKFDPPAVYQWYYLLPPIVLLVITHYGIPVSTTFMILTLFSLSKIPAELDEMVMSLFQDGSLLGGMVRKSLYGYVIAFLVAIFFYLFTSRVLEKYFMEYPATNKNRLIWTALQWFATGWLWVQWLVQDLANIYIYIRAGRDMTNTEFGITVFVLLALLGFIFYIKGGAIQEVVRRKTNTEDIRSAAIIDFLYGLVLYIFMDDLFGIWGGKLPMSTTWVFVGLLAGRELGIRIMLEKTISSKVGKMVLGDLAKVLLGLVISVLLVYVIKLVGG